MMKHREHERRIELLAPAKNAAFGIAAINHGADAVYIGALKYGARAAAGNTVEDIAKLVAYAHRYRAKVYVALNTIVYDDELQDALALIRSVYEAGADALIIQDMGLLELDLPPLPLFASTQTHNYSLDHIRFLEQVGFQRVILARELSLKQLHEIRSATTIELEVFIHGALCVSFSGQCYLSEATQGRSANRGECAQPCRLSYTLTDSSGNVIEEHKYLLSLKDLNLSEYLQDLIHAGISSFKIEGRLKDINYVKNVTAFYRQRIDDLLEKDRSLIPASSGKTVVSFQPDPSKTFNRGFTEHFLRRRSKDILSPYTPKSTGSFVGKVITMGPRWIVLDSAEHMHNGDGICFFNDQNELLGTNINKIDGMNIFPSEMNGLEIGTSIYRNYDYSFANELQTDDTRRFIALEMQFIETPSGFAFHMEDEDGITIKYEYHSEKHPAKNKTQAEETIGRQLTKLGNSIFICTNLKITWSQPYFLPVRVCNEIRREGIRLLEEERLKQYKRQLVIVQPHNEPFPEKQLTYSANVANIKAKAFYLRHGVSSIENAFELQHKSTGKALMTMKHCLRFQYDLCPGKNKINAEPLFMHDSRNRYRLEFDCEACQMKIVIE